MNQSRLESLIESTINIGSGFFISLALWVFVIVPVWNVPVTFGDNLIITAAFTVVSVIRSYVWRRFFNARLHRRIRAALS